MATVTVDAEVDLDDVIREINTEDLIDELKIRNGRYDGSGVIIEVLLKEIKAERNLLNVMKMEAILEKFDRIPTTDLDEFLSRY